MTNNDGSTDKLGCPTCFARLTDQAQIDADECTDCHRRRIDRAVDEWRTFEDEHADVLNQN